MMNFLLKTTCLFALSLALIGCSDDRGDSFGDDTLSPSGAIDETSLGDPANPDSPAYFIESVGDTVLFPVDQAILSDEAKSILQAQAAWLVQRKQLNILIEGHADEQGTREYNVALGARRAAAVQSFLVEMGLTDARVRTVTYGKERPLEICSTERCWSKNRRAVTVIENVQAF